MKCILSVIALGLLVGSAAMADDTYTLQCKSSYDVTTPDDSMTVRGPTLLAPYVGDAVTTGQSAGGAKDKTHWGVGYSAAYTVRTGKVVISITNAQGVNVTGTSTISTDIEGELQMQLDAQTRLKVVCTIIKK